MSTKLTEQERYELLQKLTDAIRVVSKSIDDINNKLVRTEVDLELTKTELTSTSQGITVAISQFEKQINIFKKDIENFKKYSNEINNVLELKLTNFGEKFDNLNRSFELLEQKIESNSHAIKRLRQDDLDKINEKLKNIPTLQDLTKELVNENSPLATQKEMQDLALKVAEINGKLSTNFWGIVVTLISVLGGILLIYNRLPTPQPVTQPTAQPVPQQGTP